GNDLHDPLPAVSGNRARGHRCPTPAIGGVLLCALNPLGLRTRHSEPGVERRPVLDRQCGRTAVERHGELIEEADLAEHQGERCLPADTNPTSQRQEMTSSSTSGAYSRSSASAKVTSAVWPPIPMSAVSVLCDRSTPARSASQAAASTFSAPVSTSPTRGAVSPAGPTRLTGTTGGGRRGHAMDAA